MSCFVEIVLIWLMCLCSLNQAASAKVSARTIRTIVNLSIVCFQSNNLSTQSNAATSSSTSSTSTGATRKRANNVNEFDFCLICLIGVFRLDERRRQQTNCK